MLYGNAGAMREAFALLGRAPPGGGGGGEVPWLQLVGQRGALRTLTPPDLARLERRLQLSRQRHRHLKTEVLELDRRGLHGRSMEVARLKKLRLREKDRISGLIDALRRARERELLPACQLGSGAYGRVLLGRSIDPPRSLVAVKIAPLLPAEAGGGQLSSGELARESPLGREASVLHTLHECWRGPSRFPQPLHQRGLRSVGSP